MERDDELQATADELLKRQKGPERPKEIPYRDGTVFYPPPWERVKTPSKDEAERAVEPEFSATPTIQEHAEVQTLRIPEGLKKAETVHQVWDIERPPKEDDRTLKQVIVAARQQTDDARNFSAALAQGGITIAQATKDEARQSEIDYSHFESKGVYSPRLREGEFVAVTKYGQVCKLTERNTGHDFREMQEFLKPLAPEVQSIVPTQAAKLEEIQHQQDFERDRQPSRGPERVGAVERQMRSVDEVKVRGEERPRREEETARQADRLGKAREDKFDRDRFMTDPDYRREFRQQMTERQREKREIAPEQVREIQRQFERQR